MTDSRRVVVLLALLGTAMVVLPWVAPFPPEAQLDLLAARGLPPDWTHPFGTDLYARDVFSRVLAATRLTLGMALGGVMLALGIGTLVGVGSTWAPRGLATALSRLVDALLPVPRLLLLLAGSAALGPMTPGQLVLLLGLTGWLPAARLVADESRRLAAADFVLASRAAGLSPGRIALRHVFPHLGAVLTAHATLAVAGAIGAEAGLGFLGLGVAPPTPTWGNIMRDGAGVVTTHWWVTVFPALAATGAMLGCHALGESLAAITATDRRRSAR